MTNYLEQIVFEGFAEKEGSFKVGKKEISYKIRTLTHEQQTQIDGIMNNLDDKHVIGAGHHYILEILARTLVELDGKPFQSVENCREFLLSRPSVFVKSLGRIQGNLEKAVGEQLNPEMVEETFSQTPSTKQD